jgi:hypothetical protein
MKSEKKIGGIIRKDAINFTFQVRAFRPLTQEELASAYLFWNQTRDKRKSLKNKTVTMESNIGLPEA